MTDSKEANRKAIAPFLKWAGGKRWFVTRFLSLAPTSFDRYVEPFLGSGAMYFCLQPNNALLSDINEELVGTYKAIRDDWEAVYNQLKIHHSKHSKEHYYLVRRTNVETPHDRAARFLYLNRTCWNGLYRVNLKGIFNVPIGTKQSVIMADDDFEAVAGLLHQAKIISSDFEKVINKTRKGDFLFVDPPYTVKHENNGFIKYNEKLFKWEHQIKLHECLRSAANRGVKVLLTNAAHHSICELYSGDFTIKRVSRHSVIAADSLKRRVSEELVIRSY